MPKKFIYCDYAANTPLGEAARKAMLPFWSGKMFGNASALHAVGQQVREALTLARESVAGVLGCAPEEVVFTSGGTESDNLALRGVAEAYGKKHTSRRRGHIVVSAVEHHAILRTAEYLEKQGFKVTYLPVDEDGLVNPNAVHKAIRKNTLLVSVMYANNEVGTVQPIAEIGKICREKKVLFHVDAVQAAGALPLNVQKLNCDLLSLSGHKFYGPTGVGVLFVRNGVRLQAQNLGGSQEAKRRASTENVMGIVGLAAALREADKKREKENVRLMKLRDVFVKEVLRKIPDTKFNGHKTKRLPGNAHFCFVGIEGESLLMKLSEKGIAISTVSACASADLEPSHVLTAMRIRPVVAHGSARFTFGASTTAADVKYILQVLPAVVQELRAMSPIYTPGMLAKYVKFKKK